PFGIGNPSILPLSRNRSPYHKLDNLPAWLLSYRGGSDYLLCGVRPLANANHYAPPEERGGNDHIERTERKSTGIRCIRDLITVGTFQPMVDKQPNEDHT